MLYLFLSSYLCRLVFRFNCRLSILRCLRREEATSLFMEEIGPTTTSCCPKSKELKIIPLCPNLLIPIFNTVDKPSRSWCQTKLNSSSSETISMQCHPTSSIPFSSSKSAMSKVNLLLPMTPTHTSILTKG